MVVVDQPGNRSPKWIFRAAWAAVQARLRCRFASASMRAEGTTMAEKRRMTSVELVDVNALTHDISVLTAHKVDQLGGGLLVGEVESVQIVSPFVSSFVEP